MFGKRSLAAAPKRLPKPALMSSSGASVPPERPRAEREPPRDELDRRQHRDGAEREAVAQHVGDGVVADAQRARRDESDAGERDRADHRMPELVDRQAPVQVFDEEQALGDDDREQAGGQAEDGERRQRREAREPVIGDGEERTGAEDRGVHAAGDRRRDDQRDERARRELEQEQLDHEHHRGERRAERGRHAGGRAARQQDLALRTPSSAAPGR